MADLVGASEIAERLGVGPRTVDKWMELRQMPPADHVINGKVRAWEWANILRWAGDLGRLRTPELLEAYRQAFKAEPVAPRKAGRTSGLNPTQINEIIQSVEPAPVVAARYGVSEAYVYKLRRENGHGRADRGGATMKAATGVPAKKAAPVKAAAKKAPAKKRPPIKTK